MLRRICCGLGLGAARAPREPLRTLLHLEFAVPLWLQLRLRLQDPAPNPAPAPELLLRVLVRFTTLSFFADELGTGLVLDVVVVATAVANAVGT